MDIKFKVGDLLVIEMGVYSDKDWSGPVRVKQEFSKYDIRKKFLKEVYPSEDDHVNPYEFLPWLVKNGYVEDAGNCHSWYIGSYGEFDVS